jgi:hypothetical protein
MTPAISETQNTEDAGQRASTPLMSVLRLDDLMDLTGRRFGSLTAVKRGPGLYRKKRPS